MALIDIVQAIRSGLPGGTTIDLGSEFLFDQSRAPPRIVAVPVDGIFGPSETQRRQPRSLGVVHENIQMHLWARGREGVEGSDFTACEDLRANLLQVLRDLAVGSFTLSGQSWPQQAGEEITQFGRSLVLEVRLELPIVPTVRQTDTAEAAHLTQTNGLHFPTPMPDGHNVDDPSVTNP